jgi:hypothetical protein
MGNLESFAVYHAPRLGRRSTGSMQRDLARHSVVRNPAEKCDFRSRRDLERSGEEAFPARAPVLTFSIMQAYGLTPDPAPLAQPLLDSEIHLAEARARRLTRPSVAPLAAEAIAGVIAGLATGGMAGPLGAVVGAFLGGAIGVGTGVALGILQTVHHVHDERLDADIGVLGGEVGAGEQAGLEYPPSILGLYSAGSAASAFVGMTTAPSEGPMQEPT